MKVFLSFSGKYSYEHAKLFKKLLSHVLQPVNIFLSSDIDKGKNWYGTILKELQEADYSVIFLTRENKKAQWINFEAGAIKGRGLSVSAILLNLGPSELEPPISELQHTLPEKEDILSLIRSINDFEESGPKINHEIIKNAFEANWANFKSSIEILSEEHETPPSDRELLDDINLQNQNSYYLLKSLVNSLQMQMVNEITNYKIPEDIEGEILDDLSSKRKAEIVRLFFGIGRETSISVQGIGERFDLPEKKVIQLFNEAIEEIKRKL